MKKYDSKTLFNEVGVDLNIHKKGTYLAVAALKPLFVSKTLEGNKRKNKKELTNAISCRHVKFFAKAIFYAEKPGGSAYKTVLGHAIEMIPQKDPCLLKAGDYLPVKVLFKGKPLAGELIYATYVGFSTRERISVHCQNRCRWNSKHPYRSTRYLVGQDSIEKSA